MRAVLLSAIAAMTIAAPAHAVSFTSIGATATPGGNVDPGLAPNEAALVTFDAAPAAGISITNSGAVALYTGNSSNAAAPAGDTSQYMGIGTGGSSTINFASYFASSVKPIRSLSVYVGSVDTYNTIEVLNNVGNVLKTITGSDLPGSNGDQGAALTNRRLYINFDPSENVSALRFSSSGVAFEFDTIAGGIGAVPEPAQWSLMIGGFGMIGGAMRRRARTSVRFA